MTAHSKHPDHRVVVGIMRSNECPSVSVSRFNDKIWSKPVCWYTATEEMGAVHQPFADKIDQKYRFHFRVNSPDSLPYSAYLTC